VRFDGWHPAGSSSLPVVSQLLSAVCTWYLIVWCVEPVFPLLIIAFVIIRLETCVVLMVLAWCSWTDTGKRHNQTLTSLYEVVNACRYHYLTCGMPVCRWIHSEFAVCYAAFLWWCMNISCPSVRRREWPGVDVLCFRTQVASYYLELNSMQPVTPSPKSHELNFGEQSKTVYVPLLGCVFVNGYLHTKFLPT